jgi:tetratricopeptide (TPR) repeat protein
MATYKKKDKVAKQLEKDHASIEAQSTTKEVFEGLDSGANKIESWIIQRQKYLLIGIGLIVAIVLGYLAYLHFIMDPAEKNAADELAYPKAYFEEAIAMAEPVDSLYKLALNGDGAKSGLLDIIDQYGRTKAGNLAKYYAGISYLKMADTKKAIEYLDEFSSDDLMLGAVAKGAIGDAFIDLNKLEDAMKYYEEAYQLNPNTLTTPIFMDKAAKTALALKDFSKAEELYVKIKENYPASQVAQDIDIKINLSKYSK